MSYVKQFVYGHPIFLNLHSSAPLSNSASVCLSVCQSLRTCIRPCVRSSVCLYVHLSVCVPFVDVVLVYVLFHYGHYAYIIVNNHREYIGMAVYTFSPGGQKIELRKMHDTTGWQIVPLRIDRAIVSKIPGLVMTCFHHDQVATSIMSYLNPTWKLMIN